MKNEQLPPTDIHKRMDILEEKIDYLISLIDKKKKSKPTNEKSQESQVLERIFEQYKKLINKRSRLITKAKQKINLRLKEFSPEELLTAIEKFSQNAWWMKHNAHRGIAWFFHSEERIEQFLNLVAEKAQKKLKLMHSGQPCKLMDKSLKIYAPWSSSWLDWNQNHPQYELFELFDDGKKIASGQEAYQKYFAEFNKK